jgi:N-methylhydantoinase A/oxoprolinase/acetone carboxylase beta subunit
VFDAAALSSSEVIEGPALIEDADTSIVVPQGARLALAEELDAFQLELER